MTKREIAEQLKAIESKFHGYEPPPEMKPVGYWDTCNKLAKLRKEIEADAQREEAEVAQVKAAIENAGRQPISDRVAMRPEEGQSEDVWINLKAVGPGMRIVIENTDALRMPIQRWPQSLEQRVHEVR